MQGDIELPFGNGTYLFNVAKHKQMFELQDRCGVIATGTDGESIPVPCGPLEILNRLRRGTWREVDVVATIELGLVGGGMSIPEKNKLMREFVADEPKGLLAATAARIVFAAVYGAEPLKKATTDRAASEGAETTLPDPSLTEQAPRSA